MPGIIGGANWGGGAFDPDTGMLYVKTSNNATMSKRRAPESESVDPRASEVDAEWSGDLTASASFHGGLPLTKPPYGHLTAVNLNRGNIAWHEPFGDAPQLRQKSGAREHRAAGRLGASGPMGGIVTKGGLVFIGGGDNALSCDRQDDGQGTLEGRSNPAARPVIR